MDAFTETIKSRRSIRSYPKGESIRPLKKGSVVKWL